MESLVSNRISLKLLASGRYVWVIEAEFRPESPEATIKLISQIDGSLKNTFPDHAERGSGRVKEIDEDYGA